MEELMVRVGWCGFGIRLDNGIFFGEDVSIGVY